MLQQPTEPFAALDLPGDAAHVFIRGNDLVIQTLVISFMMVVSQIFLDRLAKGLFDGRIADFVADDAKQLTSLETQLRETFEKIITSLK